MEIFIKKQVLSTLLSCASSWVTELFQDLWDPLLPTSFAEEKDIFGVTPSLLEEHIAELTNGNLKFLEAIRSGFILEGE